MVNKNLVKIYGYYYVIILGWFLSLTMIYLVYGDNWWYIYSNQSGWWWLDHLEKWWTSSMSFGWHPYNMKWTNNPVMFETTHQDIYIYGFKIWHASHIWNGIYIYIEIWYIWLSLNIRYQCYFLSILQYIYIFIYIYIYHGTFGNHQLWIFSFRTTDFPNKFPGGWCKNRVHRNFAKRL